MTKIKKNAAEAAKITELEQKSQFLKSRDVGCFVTFLWPTTQTHELICSTDDSTGFPSCGTHSLRKTTHLSALSTALEMARSRHAVAVEMVMTAEKESMTLIDAIKMRAAINHHLRALTLNCETRRLRAASHTSSLNKGKSIARAHFVGAARRVIVTNRLTPGGRRLTARGRDLAVVSYDHTANISPQTYFADILFLLLVT